LPRPFGPPDKRTTLGSGRRSRCVQRPRWRRSHAQPRAGRTVARHGRPGPALAGGSGVLAGTRRRAPARPPPCPRPACRMRPPSGRRTGRGEPCKRSSTRRAVPAVYGVRRQRCRPWPGRPYSVSAQTGARMPAFTGRPFRASSGPSVRALSDGFLVRFDLEQLRGALLNSAAVWHRPRAGTGRGGARQRTTSVDEARLATVDGQRRGRGQRRSPAGKSFRSSSAWRMKH